VPKEVVTGLANVKYSNALVIDENLYKANIEPLALVLVDALTEVFLRPMLRAKGYSEADLNRIIVWYDPSEIVTRPNQASRRQRRLRPLVIGPHAWRREHGFGDDDAPTEAELGMMLLTSGVPLPPDVQMALLQAMLPKVLGKQREENVGAQPVPFPQSGRRSWPRPLKPRPTSATQRPERTPRERAEAVHHRDHRGRPPDDPVHEVVAEDAHVTLQFLGEAADLSEEQITEIKQTLEMLASVVYPFPADISGTAELGPDKAQVLLVQSELLTKIREMLGMSEAVSTAVASVEQFPNWIPHLTLAYEGEMPDVAATRVGQIGSLELWLAEEHHVYRLAQPKDGPVTAAGQKIFEEGLHPRGADGRFIEKFGVIKYLTGSAGSLRQGRGDLPRPRHSGAIKLTVTPSDLSGKTSGARASCWCPSRSTARPRPRRTCHQRWSA
jgi:2'-5' RNA ligase